MKMGSRLLSTDQRTLFSIVQRQSPETTERDFLYIIQNLERLRIRFLIRNRQDAELTFVTARFFRAPHSYLNYGAAAGASLRLFPLSPDLRRDAVVDCLMAIGVLIQFMAPDDDMGDFQPGHVEGSFCVLPRNRRLRMEEDMAIGFNLLKKLLKLPTFYSTISRQVSECDFQVDMEVRNEQGPRFSTGF